MSNVDAAEIAKFSELAHRWWDPNSEFRPLHEINPLRLKWIDGLAPLNGKKVLDVGCGGGILSEAMAGAGAVVSGIDLSEKALKIARLHLTNPQKRRLPAGVGRGLRRTARRRIRHRHLHGECSKHVPDPPRWSPPARAWSSRAAGWVLLHAQTATRKSYLFAVLGAEYVLKLLPRGTHGLRQIHPARRARPHGAANPALDTEELIGMTYKPR